jgi:hypothetical protein
VDPENVVTGLRTAVVSVGGVGRRLAGSISSVDRRRPR